MTAANDMQASKTMSPPAKNQGGKLWREQLSFSGSCFVDVTNLTGNQKFLEQPAVVQ